MNYAPAAAEKAEPLVTGTALVSGFLETKERTDQFVFDLLHKHGAFSKIIAYNSDTAFAKKRLISRSARYSGLGNVLEFAEGSMEELLGYGSKLETEGVDAWLSFGVEPEDVAAHATAAVKAGVKSVVVVCSSAGKVDFSAAEAAVADSETSFTFVQVGEILDGALKEGGPIALTATTDAEEVFIEEGMGVTREDAVRVAAEAFMLPPAQKKGFALVAGNETSAAYLKSLRSEGYTRSQEIGFLMTSGLAEFATESEISAVEKAEKKAKAEAAFEPTQTQEEQEAQIRELTEKNKAKRIERREAQLKKAAEMDLRVEFIKQKFKPVEEGGGVTDEEEYFAKNLDRAIEDLKAISYFDERDNLVTVREEDLIELEGEGEDGAEKKEEEEEKELDTVGASSEKEE